MVEILEVAAQVNDQMPYLIRKLWPWPRPEGTLLA
jgi:hypothetical protein